MPEDISPFSFNERIGIRRSCHKSDPAFVSSMLYNDLFRHSDKRHQKRKDSKNAEKLYGSLHDDRGINGSSDSHRGGKRAYAESMAIYGDTRRARVLRNLSYDNREGRSLVQILRHKPEAAAHHHTSRVLDEQRS